MSDKNKPTIYTPKPKIDSGVENHFGNNVIDFPVERVRPMEQEENIQRVRDIRKIDNIIKHHGTMILKSLGAKSYNTMSNQFMNDFTMVLEALRSSLYRSIGEDHPLHDLIDNRPSEFMAYFVDEECLDDLD